MILKYFDFISESSLALINESFVYYSPKLINILNGLHGKGNVIASDLLSALGTNIKPDITFVDIDKDGYLSFITMRNAKRLIEPVYPHVLGNNPDSIETSSNIGIAGAIWDMDLRSDKIGITKKSRNLIKLGKFVNQVRPKKYTDKEIEDFVNEFKAQIENVKEKFLIVEGDDIEKWYDTSTYAQLSGSLGNSCMRTKKGIFSIYTNNPEVCKMLILIEEEKLKGRALVWKVDHKSPEFEYFLDRQYTILESDVSKFRNYAKEKGWAYKTQNSHTALGSVTYGEEDYELYDMKVQLKQLNGSYDYKKYPYVDTFRTYNPLTGVLRNIKDEDTEGMYLLEDTGGSMIIVGNNEDVVYSEYYGEDIPEDDAVYSDPLNSYIWRNNATYVEHGDRRNLGWWPSDHDEIIYDEYADRSIHIDDAVYSDLYNSHILADESISVVSKIYKNGDCKSDGYYVYSDDDSSYVSFDDVSSQEWHKWCRKKYQNWSNFTGILSSILDSVDGDNFIPSVLKAWCYKLKSGKPVYKDIDYLQLEDMFILGVEIDTESLKNKEYELFFTDKISYTRKLIEWNILNDLSDKSKDAIERYESEKENDNLGMLYINSNTSKISERIEEIRDKYYLPID